MKPARRAWLERIVARTARAISRNWSRPDRLWWAEDLPLRTARVGDTEICYATAGEGPPVILVHGFATSLSIWANQIRPLSDSFWVTDLDLIGHGYSAKPEIEYTVQAYTDVLVGLLDVLGIPFATFVGNSMGGLLCLCLAQTPPERVDRLVLIGSNSPLYKPPRMRAIREFAEKSPWLSGRLWNLFELVVPIPLKWIERKGRSNMLDDPDVLGQEWVDHLYELRRMKGFSHMVVSTMRNLMDLTLYENAVHQVSQATCLIWGQSDRVIPVEHGRTLQRTLRAARLEIIPGCGHLPMLEKPELTTELIRSFLTDPMSGQGQSILRGLEKN